MDSLSPAPPRVWRPDDRAAELAAVPAPDGVTRIGAVRQREVVTVRGRVQSVQISALASSPTLTCELTDGTGHLTVQFYGRRSVAGIEPGAPLQVSGRAAERHGETVIANPVYELVPSH